MADQKKERPSPEEEPNGADAEMTGAGATGPGTPSDSMEPADDDARGPIPMADAAQQQIAALQSQRDELQSKLLRSMADYQNYARRAQQNVAEAKQQQLMDVAKALVQVMDHFDRALEVDPQKTSTEALLKGVEMVRDELVKTLEKFGITRIEAKTGDEFDPQRHEALMRQPAEGVASNHVAAQFQPGYALGELTVRPAKVSVTP